MRLKPFAFLLLALGLTVALGLAVRAGPVAGTASHQLNLGLVSNGYGVQFRHGDWIVTDTQRVAHAYIYLDGNLFIRPGGSLTLEDVTLVMASAPSDVYRISAEPGSALHIERCNIVPARPDGRFAIRIEQATFSLVDSRLSGIRPLEQRSNEGGLTLLGVSGARISGNTIVHPDSHALWLTNSLSNTIAANTIECTGQADTCGAVYLEYSHGNQITDNRLERQWDAIDLRWSWDNQVTRNELTLTDHTIGISLWNYCGNNFIADNRISNHKDYHSV